MIGKFKLIILLMLWSAHSYAIAPAELHYKPFNMSQSNSMTPFGLWFTPSYGQDFGNMGGLDKIIDQYNNDNAEMLLADLPHMRKSINVNINGDALINHIFISIGHSLSIYNEHSVLGRQAGDQYKYRYHLHMKRNTFTTQAGYALHPTSYMRFIVGGRLELGRLRFMSKTVAPTHYEHFTQKEYRERDKYSISYAGAFARAMLNFPAAPQFQLVLEMHYTALLSDVSLTAFDEEINEGNAQADGTYSLNHSNTGFRIGLAMGLYED